MNTSIHQICTLDLWIPCLSYCMLYLKIHDGAYQSEHVLQGYEILREWYKLRLPRGQILDWYLGHVQESSSPLVVPCEAWRHAKSCLERKCFREKELTKCNHLVKLPVKIFRLSLNDKLIYGMQLLHTANFTQIFPIVYAICQQILSQFQNLDFFQEMNRWLCTA